MSSPHLRLAARNGDDDAALARISTRARNNRDAFSLGPRDSTEQPSVQSLRRPAFFTRGGRAVERCATDIAVTIGFVVSYTCGDLLEAPDETEVGGERAMFLVVSIAETYGVEIADVLTELEDIVRSTEPEHRGRATYKVIQKIHEAATYFGA